MQIRALDLSDDATATAVHRIGHAAYAVEAELIGFDGIPALGESLAEMRHTDLSWVGAFSESGALAGFLAWASEPEDGVSIDRLCVDPAWFRQGVASSLLRHALTEVFPGRAVEVTTGAANAPAVALYQRLGFTRGPDFSPVPGLTMASFGRAAESTPWEGGRRSSDLA
ncbi:GNAT family N-acetyltransferase [Streptomyces virginiae]|uniref:GNAT family N-acetyltransferase n=1 Tax=Streptomyces virginiae TaxID=1961 RepID=UPI00068E3A62|nr:GNAT family N-acetyltransferase [Streptomyces virginiae]